jgi:DNA-binding FadR family transcriptional regulator
LEITAACADAVAEWLADSVRGGGVPPAKVLSQVMDLMEEFGFVFYSFELVRSPAESGSVH